MSESVSQVEKQKSTRKNVAAIYVPPFRRDSSDPKTSQNQEKSENDKSEICQGYVVKVPKSIQKMATTCLQDVGRSVGQLNLSKSEARKPPPNCCEDEDRVEEKRPKTNMFHNSKMAVSRNLGRPQNGYNQTVWFKVEEFLGLKTPYIDSHCHTDFIFDTLKCQQSVGLKDWMIQYPNSFPKSFFGCIANFIKPELFTPCEPTSHHYDPNWILKEVEECSFYLGTTWGCHPHNAGRWGNEEIFWKTMNEILEQKDALKIVGVGECGIDLHRCESPLEVQRETFRRQIQLAFKYDTALVIHCRNGIKGNAEEHCLQILAEEMKKPGCHRYLRIHRHCYTEDWPNAKRWMEVCPNIVFGYTPAVFSFNPAQLEAVENLPMDRILLETDAPYFKPKVLESCSPAKCALPGMAAATAFRIASVKNLQVEEVLRCTFNNTRRIYGLQI